MNEVSRELLTRQEYFEDVSRRAAQCGSGDRLVIVTMSFDPADPKVSELLAALGEAAGRGADVRFMMDAYPFLMHGGMRPGPLFWHAKLPERMRGPFGQAAAALARLRTAGVKVTILNLPRRAFTLPIAGRSHIKYALVNDRVYLGGCNLDWHTKVDVMAAWEDAPTAHWLHELTANMVKTGSALEAAGGQDQTLELNETDSLLFDAGAVGRSLIMNRAMELIDQANERIYFACQFFPNDATSRHLLAAQRRGVKVEILYNHSGQQAFPHNLLHQYVEARERRRLPASFFVHALRRKQPILHAKLIATERGVIMGSHNFLTAGVRLGTAEIALLSMDPSLGQRAVENLRDQIK